MMQKAGVTKRQPTQRIISFLGSPEPPPPGQLWRHWSLSHACVKSNRISASPSSLLPLNRCHLVTTPPTFHSIFETVGRSKTPLMPVTASLPTPPLTPTVILKTPLATQHPTALTLTPNFVPPCSKHIVLERIHRHRFITATSSSPSSSLLSKPSVRVPRPSSWFPLITGEVSPTEVATSARSGELVRQHRRWSTMDRHPRRVHGSIDPAHEIFH
jgi:hypothetical protein